MDYLIIIGFIVLLGLIYHILAKLNSLSGGNESKLYLDMIENLRKQVQSGDFENRKYLQERMDFLSKQLSNHQYKSLESIQQQFGVSNKIIADVSNKLSTLDATNKQVLSFTEQVKSLENILRNPKQRGVLGEYLLENLLQNILAPNQYQMQYKFKNGEIVDSVIFFKDKLIPIDAKFTLEKYNLLNQETDKKRREQLEKDCKADIKARIDETSKYIRPNEDTTDFAFMFIPAEGVYYNLLVYNVGNTDETTSDLVKYAFKKHVIIVSPTSFYAYLETVLQGLKALKMEESVKEIQKRVDELGKHLGAYESYLSKLGNNLSTTVNSYNLASKEFNKIDRDIYKISEQEVSILENEIPLIDKPSTEE